MKKSILFILILFIIAAYKLISINKYGEKIGEGMNTSNLNSEDTTREYLEVIKENREVEDILIDGKWKLIWQDEFETAEIDKSNWTILNRKDNYNNELQFYSQENVIQKNGILNIIGKKEFKDGKSYTSGLVDTRGKFSFSYGRIDIKAENPIGTGLFPAIWLLPDRIGKPYPEVDIMEMIGQEPLNIYGVVHYENNGKYSKNYNIFELETDMEYHLYTLEWDESSLKWYVDGNLFHSSNLGVPQENMYVTLNLAIGGNWPGNPNADTEFPTNFNIDYVRVYKEIKND